MHIAIIACIDSFSSSVASFKVNKTMQTFWCQLEFSLLSISNVCNKHIYHQLILNCNDRKKRKKKIGRPVHSSNKITQPRADPVLKSPQILISLLNGLMLQRDIPISSQILLLFKTQLH